MGIAQPPKCSSTMDLDMVMSSSLGPDVAMVPSGSKGHPDLYDPNGNMIFG